MQLMLRPLNLNVSTQKLISFSIPGKDDLEYAFLSFVILKTQM